MKNLWIKVGIISVVILLIWGFSTTNYSSGKDEELSFAKLGLINQYYKIGYVDYREILGEGSRKSEDDLTWEITYKAQQEYIDKVEADRINHEKFVEILKKEKEIVAVSRSNYNSGYRNFEATYYSAFCKTCSGTGITASGVSVANSIYYKGYRVIASHENEIPMWSIVEIKTHYGTFQAVALDRGGFKAGGIDILVNSTKEAYQLGRHDVQVRIIGKIK